MTDSDKPRRSVTRMPPAAIRLEFGRTIQRHLNERGWTQAELARRMKPFLKDSRIGRDSISKYVRGKNLPNPPVLEAMAKAFGVESRELLPSRGTQAVSKEHAPLDVRDIGRGPSVAERQPGVRLADSVEGNRSAEGDERSLEA